MSDRGVADRAGRVGAGGRGATLLAVVLLVAALAGPALAPWAQEPVPAGADSAAAPADSAGGAGADTSFAPAAGDTAGDPFAAPPGRRHPRPARAASWLTSERFVDRTVGGEPVSYLYGNVYLDRDTVVVRADSAHVYRERRLVRLFGDVQARRSATRLASDEADYRQDSGDADFRGDVRVWEDRVVGRAELGELRDSTQTLRLIREAVLVAPEFTVRADTIARDRRRDHGEAFGDVRIVDPGAATLVTGRHAIYADDGSWARVDVAPSLTTREEGGAPIHSEAGDMRFFRAEERVVMTDSVRIRQGPTLAIADTAVILGREHMVLTGAPEVAIGDESRMRGDRITFFYRDGRLNRAILVGRAHVEDTDPDSLAALYAGLPRLEVIEGDSITIDFAEGEIRRTVVVGSAQSVYVPVDVDEEIAFNEVAGDTLVLDFVGGRVRQVEVRGAMKGTYHFARIAALHGPAAADTLAAIAADSLAPAAADTLAVFAADSLATGGADTLAVFAADSLAAPDSTAVGRAGGPPWDFAARAEKVDYQGRSVRFDLREMTIAISGDAKLNYGTMTLTARDVVLDTRTRELYASGEPMIEDEETIVGQRMGYDFGSRTGAVRDGVTTFDGYYYVGDEIHRYPDGSLKIQSGRMTSCDLAEPHYHFWSDRMKMRLGDQVVAAPVVMRVGRVPVFALPFYFKSLEKGRRSGILFPNFNFGWSSREGRYIRDLGYYWATSEYTDFTFEADYNERREFAWRIRNRYVKRYGFDGDAAYSRRQTLDDQDMREWQLQWSHSQPRLFDDYQFRADVRMASRTLSSNDLNANVGRDVIDGELTSKAYVSRNFGWLNASMNLERTQQINAEDDDPRSNNVLTQTTLPSLSLSLRQIALAPALKPGQHGSVLGDLARATYFTQSYQAHAGVTEREVTRQRSYTARGSWGLRVQADRIGPLNPNFGASGALSWQRDEVTGESFRLLAPPDSGFYAPLDSLRDESTPSLSFSAGATTTLYGVFPARIGALRAIRHAVQLGAGLTYTPQLGDKQQAGERYSFNMAHRFDVKYAGAGAAGDTVESLKKLDGILDWTTSTGYSPRAGRGRQWSPITSSLTIRPGQSRNLSVKMSNAIDPYALAVTSTTLSYGYGFHGRLDTGWRGEARATERSAQIDRLGAAGADSLAALADSLARAEADSLADPFDETADAGFYGDLGPAFDEGPAPPGGSQRDPTDGGRFLPWAVNGSISYNRNNVSDIATARAGVTLTANLTRDWQFMYTTSFDLSEGTMSRQEYRLQRDLHCWRLEFNRTVSGIDSQFGFRFYLKAIPELKLTQGKEDLMGRAGSLAGSTLMGGF